VKALNRRFADGGTIEYSDFMAEADLVARLCQEVSTFFDAPLTWKGDTSAPPDRERSV